MSHTDAPTGTGSATHEPETTPKFCCRSCGHDKYNFLGHITIRDADTPVSKKLYECAECSAPFGDPEKWSSPTGLWLQERGEEIRGTAQKAERTVRGLVGKLGRALADIDKNADSQDV